MIPPRANPDLFGQTRVWEVLLRSLRSGRVPHAWLLTGPRGVGKATLAHRFARALLAPPGELTSATSARDDPTFRQCATEAHPDLAVLEPPPTRVARARSEIGVDAVRAATRALHRTTALGGRRVLLVDGAETLNRNAVNALLKPLEEPPPATVVLLVCHEPLRLPATVRSRCAALRLARLEISVIERILAAQAPELDPELRTQAAGLAYGSAGRAFELARGGLEHYRSLVVTLGAPSVDPQDLHELAERLRQIEVVGGDAVTVLLQLFLARIVGFAAGRAGAPLFAEEPDALQRLAARRPLERWPALWEKVARLLQRADALNLDRAHVLLLVLGDLANASEQAHPPAPLQRGGLDAGG